MEFNYTTDTDLSSSAKFGRGYFITEKEFDLTIDKESYVPSYLFGTNENDSIEFYVQNINNETLYASSIEETGSFVYREEKFRNYDGFDKTYKVNVFNGKYLNLIGDFQFDKSQSYSEVVLNPANDLLSSGVTDGRYKIIYFLTNNLVGSPKQDEQLIITGISNTRREIKCIPKGNRNSFRPQDKKLNNQFYNFFYGKTDVKDVEGLIVRQLDTVNFDDVFAEVKEEKGKEFEEEITRIVGKYSYKEESRLIEEMTLYFSDIFSNFRKTLYLRYNDSVSLEELFEEYTNWTNHVLVNSQRLVNAPEEDISVYREILQYAFDYKRIDDLRINKPKNYYRNAVNFGNGNVFQVVNYTGSFQNRPELGSDGTQHSELIVKLKNPLSIDYEVNDSFWISSLDVTPPVIVDVLFSGASPIQVFTLSGPDFQVEPVSKQTQTKFETYDSLIKLGSGSLNDKVLNYLNSKLDDSKLNVNYDEWENFIVMSSAKNRIQNFTYKLNEISKQKRNIEYYEDLVEQYSSSAVIEKNLGNDENYKRYVLAYQTLIDNELQESIDIKRGWEQSFDGYETFLYESTSSRSWPKQPDTFDDNGNAVPYYIPEDINDLNANALIWYQNTLASASIYDEFNDNYLVNNTAEYITKDNSNDSYIRFLNMVGHYFDLIYLYIDNISNNKIKEESVLKGMSNDLVASILNSLGWDTINSADLEDLQSLVEGSSNRSNDWELQSADSLQKTKWRRILNNLNHIYKTKGSEDAVRVLLSCYGIPNELFKIREYGGLVTNEKVDNKSDYTFDNSTFILPISSSTNQYISVPWVTDYDVSSSQAFSSSYSSSISSSIKATTLVDEIRTIDNLISFASSQNDEPLRVTYLTDKKDLYVSNFSYIEDNNISTEKMSQSYQSSNVDDWIFEPLSLYSFVDALELFWYENFKINNIPPFNPTSSVRTLEFQASFNGDLSDRKYDYPIVHGENWVFGAERLKKEWGRFYFRVKSLTGGDDYYSFIPQIPASWDGLLPTGSINLGTYITSSLHDEIEEKLILPIFSDKQFTIAIRKSLRDSRYDYVPGQEYKIPVEYDCIVKYRDENSNLMIQTSQSFFLGADYNENFFTGSHVYFGNYSSSINREQPYQFGGNIGNVRFYSSKISESRIDSHAAFNDGVDTGNKDDTYDTLIFRYDTSYPQNLYSTSSVTSLSSSAWNTSLIKSSSFFNFFESDEYPYQYVPYQKRETIKLPVFGGQTFGNKFFFETGSEQVGKLDINNRSTLSINEKRPTDTNTAAVYFSPIEVINDKIIEFLGETDFGDLIGDPEDLFNEFYGELNNFKPTFTKTGASQFNWQSYINVAKSTFDRALFEYIESLLPARSRKLVGLLVQPSLLERPKLPVKRMESQVSQYTAEIENKQILESELLSTRKNKKTLEEKIYNEQPDKVVQNSFLLPLSASLQRTRENEPFESFYQNYTNTTNVNYIDDGNIQSKELFVNYGLFRLHGKSYKVEVYNNSYKRSVLDYTQTTQSLNAQFSGSNIIGYTENRNDDVISKNINKQFDDLNVIEVKDNVVNLPYTSSGTFFTSSFTTGSTPSSFVYSGSIELPFTASISFNLPFGLTNIPFEYDETDFDLIIGTVGYKTYSGSFIYNYNEEIEAVTTNVEYNVTSSIQVPFKQYMIEYVGNNDAQLFHGYPNNSYKSKRTNSKIGVNTRTTTINDETALEDGSYPIIRRREIFSREGYEEGSVDYYWFATGSLVERKVKVIKNCTRTEQFPSQLHYILPEDFINSIENGTPYTAQTEYDFVDISGTYSGSLQTVDDGYYLSGSFSGLIDNMTYTDDKIEGCFSGSLAGSLPLYTISGIMKYVNVIYDFVPTYAYTGSRFEGKITTLS